MQFSKVDIKPNNVSTVIFWIKFLVYQWEPRHLQGSRVVYIFVYITKSVFSLISNYVFVYFNHKVTFFLIISDVQKDLSSLQIKKKLKPKVQFEDEFIFIIN